MLTALTIIAAASAAAASFWAGYLRGLRRANTTQIDHLVAAAGDRPRHRAEHLERDTRPIRIRRSD